ncbi:MAG: type II toxin-antitoxin system VapC family toxin [SAR324 cluster bacterium]|uniref:Type II toxin-antitoxin system VapC family toxin n=1 Tax=SAR324 cluster bacterium TaxID=2024889 RepID=A0A7X9IKK9_9DELT|nr:type II toxin-antitoxin system VapC family toxin [SAR324 cluster bacterium]
MLNLDTHILLFALSGELTKKEKKLLSEHEWSISGIVLWEIAMLSKLKRIELSIDDKEVIQILSRIHTWPITVDIARALMHIDIKSDPADEIIAATSIVHKVPLLTRDKTLKKSKIIPLAWHSEL